MSKLKDLTGKLFGFLSVQRRLPNYIQANGRTRTRWLCICLLCGNAYIADGSHLLHGDVISCGCFKNMKTAIRGHAQKGTRKEIEDLSGQVFGCLEVLERCENLGRRTAWLCRCMLCGKTKKIRGNHLKRGAVTTCGCNSFSRTEIKIMNVLNKNNIHYTTQYSFSDLVSEKGYPLRFDFALLDSKHNIVCVIEYQGEQHSRDRTSYYGKQQRESTDKQKIDYCLTNRITYFAIWYFHNLEEEINKIIEFYHKSTTVPSSI